MHPVIIDNQVDLEDVYAEMDYDMGDVIPEVQGVVRRTREKQSDLKGEAGDQVDPENLVTPDRGIYIHTYIYIHIYK
jgi:hypothetical protein